MWETLDFNNILNLKIPRYSFVRSKLEYGALVLYPLYLYQTKASEGVQHKGLELSYNKVEGEA